jgi:hypothetical protein
MMPGNVLFVKASCGFAKNESIGICIWGNFEQFGNAGPLSGFTDSELNKRITVINHDMY